MTEATDVVQKRTTMHLGVFGAVFTVAGTIAAGDCYGGPVYSCQKLRFRVEMVQEA